MSRLTTLKDIDSLPYHALQAEAAKHSIRRNLGAAKLREALRELLGNNPNPNKLPPHWFIAATNPSVSKPPEAPAHPIKTNARIKSTAAAAAAPQTLHRPPLMPQPPRNTQTRRTKNPTTLPTPPNSQPSVPPSIPEPSSSAPEVPARADSPSQPQRNHHKTSTESIPPTAKIPPPTIDHSSSRPTSPQVTERSNKPNQNHSDQLTLKPASREESFQNHHVHTNNSCNHPTETQQPSLCSSEQILPQSIRAEADRLGLSNYCSDRNIDFLTRLVRDTLQELHRGQKVLCTLQASSKPIKYITPKSTPSGRTKIYRNDPQEGCPQVPTLPSPTRASAPSSEEHHPDETEKSQSAICKASPRHPVFYVSTPANFAAFQPPRIPLPSLCKGLDPSSSSCDNLPLEHRSHHPDQTSTSSTLDQPAYLGPPSFQAPTTTSDPIKCANTLEGRPLKTQSHAEPNIISPIVSPVVDDTFASPRRVTPLRHKTREKKRSQSIDRDQIENIEPLEGPTTKKRKLDEPNIDQVGNSNNQQVPSSSSTSKNPDREPEAENQIPLTLPLRLFKSPPKGHIIVGRRVLERPSPVSSPMGPLGNPTLFGTEHYYGDSSSARFGEMFLRGPSVLLPSPLNKKFHK